MRYRPHAKPPKSTHNYRLTRTNLHHQLEQRNPLEQKTPSQPTTTRTSSHQGQRPEPGRRRSAEAGGRSAEAGRSGGQAQAGQAQAGQAQAQAGQAQAQAGQAQAGQGWQGRRKHRGRAEG